MKMSRFKKIMQQMLTGRDNLTYDLGRVLWAFAFFVGVIADIACQAVGQVFNLTDFGLGVGALLTAGGLALKLKENTEPKGKDEPHDA